jgi:acyl carrier protein
MTVDDIRGGVAEELARLLTAELDEFSVENVGEQTLDDLGVDSLMMLEFLMNVEKRFGIPEPEEEPDDQWIKQFRTLDDVIRMVAESFDVSTAA